MALTPPFANASDLADMPISEGVRDRATALLMAASQMILDEDVHGVLDDLDEPTPTIVRITCAVAVRAALAGQDPVPAATQTSWSAGPFGGSTSYSAPAGDLYLSRAEKRQLGLSRQRAGGVDMWAGAYRGA